MDPDHISTLIVFLLEGNDIIAFSNSPLKHSLRPVEEQLQKKITGILLYYAYNFKQNFGIETIKSAFEADSNGIIHKVPNNLILDTQDDITILKYGNINISPHMFELAKQFGVVGYWDDSNLIICTSKEYKEIMESIINFIQANKVKFTFKDSFLGPHLLIVKA